jgi:hypothetical protein
MQHNDSLLPTATGFKRFFSPRPLDSRELSIRGIGIRELMPPGMIERPHGTGDYLFMLFHDPAVAGIRPMTEPPGGPDTMMVWPPGKAQYYGYSDGGVVVLNRHFYGHRYYGRGFARVGGFRRH